jgi:pimeloyl-ACP methyl ester carboxylesterase
MIAPLAKLMDWTAIQVLTLTMPSDFMQPPRLEEALEFLKKPVVFSDESQVTRRDFDSDKSEIHFRFPSPQPGSCAENNIVYGRLYRCGERWWERATVILLHGAGDSFSYNIRFPSVARQCNEAGFNVAALVAPYHFQRRPGRRGADGARDCLEIAEASSQVVAEIRALTGWLLREGCPAVALWGYSLGARYAGLAACREDRLAAVIMAGPNARLSPCVEELAVRPRVRKNLPMIREVCDELNQTPLNLLAAQPVIPTENILLTCAIHDSTISPKEEIEELQQAWGQTDIWRLPHGHVGLCCGFAPGLTGRVIRWLGRRLGKPSIGDLQSPSNLDGAANSRQAFRFVSGWNYNIIGFGGAALPAAVADLFR